MLHNLLALVPTNHVWFTCMFFLVSGKQSMSGLFQDSPVCLVYCCWFCLSFTACTLIIEGDRNRAFDCAGNSGGWSVAAHCSLFAASLTASSPFRVPLCVLAVSSFPPPPICSATALRLPAYANGAAMLSLIAASSRTSEEHVCARTQTVAWYICGRQRSFNE